MNKSNQNPYSACDSRQSNRQQPGSQGGFVPASPAWPRHAANPYAARGAGNHAAGAHGVYEDNGSFPPPVQNASDYSRANYGAHMGAGRGGNRGGNAGRGSGGGRSGGNGKRRMWTVVLAIAVLVLIASLATLGVIGYGYWHGTKVYDEIARQSGLAKEENALADMTVDWDTLRAQNEDIVGWVYMPNTSIDYPIVQGDDDEEYLKKDFNGDTGGLVHKGAIFLSADNASDFSDENNFIYGHNMNDETMFAHILAMTDQAAFDDARTFYILTPTQNYRCRTYALDVVANTETNILQPTFADNSAMLSYMTARINNSAVNAPTDVDLASVTKLFTLITCGDDYATTRAILFGGCVEQAVPANAE